MSNREILTQAVLDRTHCETPGCTCDDSVIFLSAQCHPRAGAVAAYHKATGTMRLQCRVCALVIAEIEVAP